MKPLSKSGLLSLALTVVFSLVLAACGDDPSPTIPVVNPAAGTGERTPEIGSNPAGSGPREKVKVGVGGAAGLLAYLPIELGVALGYFDEQGLDVDLQYFQGGNEAAVPLLAGQLDFAAAPLDQAVKAKSQSQTLKMIASFTIQPALTLLVRSDLKDSLKGLKDLKGRKIGIGATGDASQVLAAFLMTKAGYKKEEAEYLAVGSGGAFLTALKNKQIEVGLASEPTASQAISAGEAVALLNFNTPEATKDLFGGQYQSAGLLAQPDTLSKKAPTAQKMVNALVKANQYIAAHTGPEVADKLGGLIVKDQASYLKAFDNAKPAFAKDGLPTLEGVKNNLQAQLAFGAAKPEQNIDPANLFDPGFVNRALGK